MEEVSEILVPSDVPKAGIGIFELPCGWVDSEGVVHKTIELNEMTGAEEDVMFSNASSAQIVDTILGNTISRLGTVTDKTIIRKAVREFTTGDRSFTMIALRRVTQGDMFQWFMKCPECGEKSTVTLDLRELATKEMKDPTQRVYDVVLPRSGKSVRWKVLDGFSESQRDKLRKKVAQDRATFAIFLRLEQLDGKPATVESVKALGAFDRQFLREKFDEIEGGIETDVDMECPECRVEIKTEVDITQKSFFFPTTLKS